MTTICYPHEQPVDESFSVGYRNFAGGGQIWSGLDTAEAAQTLLDQKKAGYADLPAGTHRALVPVTWYIERITQLRRVELVSEVLASEPLP